MPISDLLAEITGGKSSPTPVARSSTSSAGLKRKADDSDSNTSKVTKPRYADGSSSANKPGRNASSDVVEPSHSVSRLINSSSTTSKPGVSGKHSPAPSERPYKPLSNGSKSTPPISNGRPSDKPAAYAGTSMKKSNSDLPKVPSKLNTSTANKASSAESRPSPSPADPGKAPKKGSFAEIMARGKKAQQVFSKVGTIQHKAIEKSAHAPNSKFGKMQLKDRGSAAEGRKARDGPRNGTDRPAKPSGKEKKGVGRSRPGSSGSDKAAAADKKVKKASLAGAGYAGTARPRPGSTSGKPGSRHAAPGTAGGLLAPPKLGRRDRDEDEYDEELDDFIDYDEDEDDGYGNRYGYASDGSSDMEAGMSDIDMEERKAERVAKQEDREEEARLEKLKRDKEERKRQWAAGHR